MGMRIMMQVLGVGLCSLLLVPSAWAADEQTAEAAQIDATPEMTLEHLRTTIEAEADPELRAAMEEQLELLESGELSLERDLALGAPPSEVLGNTTGGLPPDLIGPPVDGGTANMPSYMTPELREQLFNVYDQVGAGELSEGEARTQAEGILREHGIDPRELGGPEHDREFGEQQYKEAFERMSPEALEHMSPEAREQMEQYREQAEQYREQAEQYREQMGTEREFETMTHEYETQSREFETPTREYEASTREYEAPTHEYEAPTHEYEAPEPMDAPEHEFEMPEGEQHEYQEPPQQP